MAALTAAGPVLVQFFDFAQLNSVSALPYVIEWERRYAGAGLSVLGVQAPRFPFGFEPETVGAGLGRLGVGFPVAIDSERRLWLDYGCKGWPSLFLWGQGGALRWVHFGEGEYLPPRRRSRPSCARRMRSAPSPSRWLRCGPPTGPASG